MSRVPAFLIALLALPMPALAAPTQSGQTAYGMFGALHMTRPPAAVGDVVLLLSDHDGWTARQDALASELASHSALVVGIDLPTYMRRLAAIGDACSYPAGHFEELAHWIERHEGITDYRYPLVVGDGSGATFAYAMAAQAPAGTFAGVFTLGWDHDMRLSEAICAGDAGTATVGDHKTGFRIEPMRAMPTPWLPRPFAPGARSNGLTHALAGLLRVVTLTLPALAQASPAADIGDAYADWNTRAKSAQIALPGDIADLPLTTVEPTSADSGRIAVMLTGDGGWAGLDKGVAEALAADGMRVIGFSTLKFFWEKRDPQEATSALERILGFYGERYPQARFTVVGYSFGASLVPVLINRLPATLAARIDMGVMISPDPEAVFEIKIGDWFGGAHHEGGVPVMPEILKSPTPILCVHGDDEDDSFCREAKAPTLRVQGFPGGHHYDGNYQGLGDLIVGALAKP